MKVLSLFDGMSCGRIALDKLDIKVDKYFACEIDKYAMKVSEANYPDIIQLGNVQFVTKETFGNHKIDLLIGGSPCQGFSFAGKQLNFEDPRSKLFFDYVRLLRDLKPKYFLLENVKMKKESQNIISEYMGCEPIEINSALVSAQNRKRLYWTNIPGIEQPEDKEILLRDILEDNVNNLTVKDGNIIKCLNPKKEDGKQTYQQDRVYDRNGKGGALTAQLNGRYKVNKIVNVNPSGNGMNGWVYDTDGKSPTLTTNKGEGNKISQDSITWRKLTPIECERLQTVPDNYTNHVSNSQRYKMLGNGWTVDVITHIFKNMEQ